MSIEQQNWWASIHQAKDQHRYILCTGIEVCFYKGNTAELFSEAERAEIHVWNGIHYSKLDVVKCNKLQWQRLQDYLYLLALVYYHGETNRQRQTLKFLGVKP